MKISTNIRGRLILQKYFSTFPGGMPGLGLLMLRLMLGITTIVQGIAYLTGDDSKPLSLTALALFAVVCGAFLLIGLITPIAALVVSFGSLATAVLIIPATNYKLLAPILLAIYMVVTAAAVVLLGPGAFSLDALMFGRREIIIPGKSDSPKS